MASVPDRDQTPIAAVGEVPRVQMPSLWGGGWGGSSF
jgi:hypothetical protein